MKTSSKKFDNQLNLIDHFDKYPAMKPYVGKNYGKDFNKKLMLIGESNYLPDSSTINNNPDIWYNSKQSDLNPEEIEWIHCRNLLQCGWKSAGHMIYRELENRLSKFIDNSNCRAMTNVVYMNAFQRPAPVTGDSIKNFCKNIDYEISAKTIDEVIKIVEPDLVIFVSKLSWDTLRWKLSKNQGTRKIDFTCHPGTGGRYWHNKEYPHGSEKFNKLLLELNICSQ